MDKLLNHPGFQKKLANHAEQTGENLGQVHEEAATYLQELYTQHKPIANVVGVQLGQYILSRAYDTTIDVNPTEVKEVAKLVRRHPVAFVMTHKTYVDMFVLALVLGRHGLPVPYRWSIGSAKRRHFHPAGHPGKPRLQIGTATFHCSFGGRKGELYVGHRRHSLPHGQTRLAKNGDFKIHHGR